MKQRTLLFTLLAAAGCALGCNKEGTTAQQLDQLQAKTAAATQDLQDYPFAQKDEYTGKMRSQLATINQELDQLAANIEKSSAAAKAEAQPKLQALRAKADQLGKQLAEANNATPSTWDSGKAGTKQAYGELKDGFAQAPPVGEREDRPVRS